MAEILGRSRKRRRSYSSGQYPFLEDTSPNIVVFNSANATFPFLSHDITFDPNSPPIIMTAHGCLLIPAAFIAWWYWTKHTTRRVVRGVITFARGSAPASVDRTALGMSEDSVFSKTGDPRTSSPSTAVSDECNDAYFGVMEDSSSHSSTAFRFIRWLKGTRGSRVRHKVRTTTRKNLRGSPNPSDCDATDCSHIQSQNALQTDSKVSGDANLLAPTCSSATYENIMAVELSSLNESSSSRLSPHRLETAVRITIETVPFGETV